MVYAKSAWYTQSLLYALTGATMTGSPAAMTWPVGSGNDQYQYISLHNSSGTDYTSTELQYGGATTTIAWTNANEVTGTGWVTGGIQMSVAGAAGGALSTTFTQFGSGPYGLEYNWTNPLSVASTTLTGIYGCVMYWHGITAPVSKPMFLELCFGTAYNTVAGTFGITPSGSGLSQLTLTA